MGSLSSFYWHARYGSDVNAPARVEVSPQQLTGSSTLVSCPPFPAFRPRSLAHPGTPTKQSIWKVPPVPADH